MFKNIDSGYCRSLKLTKTILTFLLRILYLSTTVPEMPIFNFESELGVFFGVPFRGSILDTTVGDAMGESNKCFLMISTSGFRSDANSSAIAFFNGTVKVEFF